MNLKLSVVRLANEDVITTSTSTCLDNEANHLYKVSNTNDCIKYKNCAEQHSRWEKFPDTAPDLYSESGWFYYNGSTFVQCSGDHSYLDGAHAYNSAQEAWNDHQS